MKSKLKMMTDDDDDDDDERWRAITRVAKAAERYAVFGPTNNRGD